MKATTEPAAAGVTIASDGVRLEGERIVPDGATGVVLFAHGSGSSRHSPRNRAVAATLRAGGVGTLLFDLLTEREARVDETTGERQLPVIPGAGHLFDEPGALDQVARAAADRFRLHLQPQRS